MPQIPSPFRALISVALTGLPALSLHASVTGGEICSLPVVAGSRGGPVEFLTPATRGASPRQLASAPLFLPSTPTAASARQQNPAGAKAPAPQPPLRLSFLRILTIFPLLLHPAAAPGPTPRPPTTLSELGKAHGVYTPPEYEEPPSRFLKLQKNVLAAFDALPFAASANGGGASFAH